MLEDRNTCTLLIINCWLQVLSQMLTAPELHYSENNFPSENDSDLDIHKAVNEDL